MDRHAIPFLYSFRLLGLALLSVGLLAISKQEILAQVPQDQAAEMILNSARKAFNEGNPTFAASRFREFLQKHGGHPKANDARYGLGLSLLEGPERNFEQAIDPLASVANNKEFLHHPYALYYLGLAYRGAGLNDLTQALAKPNESQQLKQRAEARFHDAVRYFDASAKAFSTKFVKVVPNEKKPLPEELDWLARAKCDQAEMELRLGKHKEARTTAEAFTKDELLPKSKYRNLGLYYHGFAAFLLQDYLVAGRSLNQLTPFQDPIYGLHARYLMGRVFQISREGAEAANMYEGVLTEYEKQKKEAIEALKRPDQFKNAPWEKSRLEQLIKTPPEYVSASVFYSACLQYEGGKFGESLTRFQQFQKDFVTSLLVPEATLRIGFCQVQLKQFPEAIATLQPLVDKQPRLADQALFWIGKAQAGVALAMDPTKPQERDNALKTALNTLRQASDRANQLIPNDLEAKVRRGEMLIELADTQQLVKQSREAAGIYEQLINEKVLPNRIEELYQRWASALHLAGDYPRSDQICKKFQEDYPNSPLMPAVLFRLAENAYFIALAADKKPDYPNRTTELPKLWEEAAKRYNGVIEKYPEFERVSLAKFGLAMCHFAKNEFDKAQEILESIPQPDRVNELALAPYLLAECLIRSAPSKADDALAAGMLQEKLANAASHLEAFISGSPKAPEIPDALLKLGYCQVRMGMLLAQPQDRNNTLNIARQTYEKIIQQFPKEVQAAQAVLERAKCMAYQGDKGGAINELRKFTTDPMQQSLVAPTAVLQLATLLREQNQAEEASKILATARQRHENQLAKEPDRIALLRYHHGVCLLESGKLIEARTVLESAIQVLPNHPLAAESALRSGQSRIADGRKQIETIRQKLTNSGLKSDERQKLQNDLQNAYNSIFDAGQFLEQRADNWRQQLPTTEARARMYYDAAWGFRLVADYQTFITRQRMAEEKQRQLQDQANKKAGPNQKASQIPLPEIILKSVPMQPGESRARTAYQKLIEGFPELLISIDARFELAELYADRDENDKAIQLLKEALDKEPTDKQPSLELMDKIRIRLGAALATKKDFEGALSQFDVIANNPKSQFIAQAHYRAGEVLLEMNEPMKAVERLKVFREKGEYQNISGISDRAFLRLGHALGLAKKWEESRQAYEQVPNRYGNSPWVHDARYGMGWAYQNLGQFDQAINWYNQVTANTHTEIAAKAHLQIGLCRMEQKKWGDAISALLIVPFTFDYPEWSAIALTEAGRALIEEKKPEQAERLFHRVLKEYPNSSWAKIAQERLDQLKK